MSEEAGGNGQESGGDEARAKRVLSEISSRAWEHPADRAALQALRKIPVFTNDLSHNIPVVEIPMTES